MGSEKDGRPKGKSKHGGRKAQGKRATVQKMGSKRKLSRFGKERKKGEQGIASAFITRTQVLKRLQITLKDFRRLCILKGIYPREPRKNLKSGKHKTYYHYKDVAHLSHEPLIGKFREFKAFMKKVRKTLGRRDVAGAKRKYQDAPTYTLQHLVKERYPQFEDALRDLDDALNLVHMFAALPSKGRVTSERTSNCRELVAQWQFFLIQCGGGQQATSAGSSQDGLSKVFITVKGVYMQADLLGVPVTWINPHEYTQHVPSDVDFRTMLTFLEFYETLMKFTLFKLYHTLGLQYPPRQIGAGGALSGESSGDGEGSTDGGFAARGRLLSLNARALDEREGPDQGEGAPAEKASEENGAKEAAQKSKAAAKRAKQVRKRLAAASAKAEEEGEEDESGEVEEGGGGRDGDGGEGDDDEEEDDDDDEDGGGRLQPSLSRAEVNRQLEEALVAATTPSSASTSGGGGTAAASSASAAPRLFDGLVFFLSRESQYSWLELVILAFGGKCGWGGSAEHGSTEDPTVTHVVYDRPTAPQLTRSDVEWVQPQWVVDSVNAALKLPVERYAPGASLPPHLSPFVDDAKEGYVPQYRTELNALKSAADEYGNLEGAAGGGGEVASAGAGQEEGEAGDDEEENEEEGDDEEEEGEEEDEEEEEEEDEAGEEEGPGDGGKPQVSEEKALALVMMSKKAKRLYDRMQHGINKKSEAVETLKRKAATSARADEDPPRKQQQQATSTSKSTTPRQLQKPNTTTPTKSALKANTKSSKKGKK